MNAPSNSCLRAMCSITFQLNHRQYLATSKRCYAASSNSTTHAIPPSSSSHPPPDASVRRPPSPNFRIPPSGTSLRSRRSDDEELTPQPLDRPIGLPYPPQPGQNTGLDTRTLSQRTEDMTDYKKHLEKRSEMARRLSKGYFRDWSNMRFHKGKLWVAPERLFKQEGAFWFPNFFGKTLAPPGRQRSAKDGYSGLGKDTCEAMYGKVSVVSIVSCEWAEQQVQTFLAQVHNTGFAPAMRENADIAQRIEINYENNFLKWWILQTFARNLRACRTVAEQERYFMVRRGVNQEMKEAIGLLNDKCGYLYLVDQECKIRWASSAEAWPAERESLVRGIRKLCNEARRSEEEKRELMERKEQLESAIAEVVRQEPVKSVPLHGHQPLA